MLSEQATKGPLLQEVLGGQRQAGGRGSAKNRGRLDTVAEIVNSCTGGANKSRIMLTANVNSIVATELINKLVTSGLLIPRKEEEGNSVAYHSTREGLDFVRKYSDLISMLPPGMLPPTRINDVSRNVNAWI